MAAETKKTEKTKKAAKAKQPALAPTKLVGFKGTTLYAGYNYEETLDALSHGRRAAIYDEMRRGDGQIKMILKAIKDPIRSSRFTFEPSGDTPQHKEAAAFCAWNWLKNPMVPWTQVLNEMLSCVDFGFSMHEHTFGVYQHRALGTVHCLTSMAFRKQSTIERWIVEGRKGLTAVEQMAYGDTVEGPSNAATVRIPASSLTILTIDQEGDNYEGISMLRAAYGAWSRKNVLLKLNMIGAEKAAVGIPIGEYPAGASKEDREDFETILGDFTLNDRNYLMAPAGYKISWTKGDFDSEKLIAGLSYEDGQISKSVLMSFFELGQGGNGGSFALGTDLSDIALAALQYIGDMICAKMCAINERLVEANFGDPDLAPTATCVGINQKAGAELAGIVKTLADARIVRTDDRLEAHMRKTYSLPEAEKSRADDPPPVPPPAPVPPSPPPVVGDDDDEQDDDDDEPPAVAKLSERGSWTPFRELTIHEQPMALRFGEMFDQRVTAGQHLDTVMNRKLNATADYLLRQLEKRWASNDGKPKTAAQKIKIAANIDFNFSSYEDMLLREMVTMAAMGAEQAAADLAAKAGKLTFADPPLKRQLEFLPPHVQETLKQQAKLQAEAQAAKLKQILGHTVGQKVADDLNDAEVISAVEDSLDEYIRSPQVAGAASTIASQSINRGRDSYFFDQANLKQIQAFQFSAVLDDRTSDICLSLDGKVFKANDPDVNRFGPPLHHGCRSILIPITIDEPEPELTGLDMDPTNPSLIREYARRGVPPPDLAKIKKSRNL